MAIGVMTASNVMEDYKMEFTTLFQIAAGVLLAIIALTWLTRPARQGSSGKFYPHTSDVEVWRERK